MAELGSADGVAGAAGDVGALLYVQWRMLPVGRVQLPVWLLRGALLLLRAQAAVRGQESQVPGQYGALKATLPDQNRTR